MKRLAWLLLPMVLVAGCEPVPRPLGPLAGTGLAHPEPPPSRCRVGPDGGPPRADRGIGGTGVSAGRLSERGIGGTGQPATLTADRGIGGTGAPDTGISGVITGFASVCVNGVEVALDPSVPILVDESARVDAGALRAGQMVAITAASDQAEPRAQAVAVRHEVIGPVEAVVSLNPGLAIVAGQRVRIPPRTEGALVVRPGVWVAVSGVRNAEGDIVASRLDRAPPGPVLVHGPLMRIDGQRSIGSLAIVGQAGGPDLAGSYVTARGVWRDGGLAATVTPDLLMTNPPAYFGPGIRHVVLEAYVRLDANEAVMAGGFRAARPPGLDGPSGPAIISLDAGENGTFRVIGLRPARAPDPLVPAGAGPGSASRRTDPGADPGHSPNTPPLVPGLPPVSGMEGGGPPGGPGLLADGMAGPVPVAGVPGGGIKLNATPIPDPSIPSAQIGSLVEESSGSDRETAARPAGGGNRAGAGGHVAAGAPRRGISFHLKPMGLRLVR